MKLNYKRVFGVLFVFLLIVGVIVYFVFSKEEEKEKEPEKPIVDTPEPPEEIIEKKLQILDLESKTRPIAIMINNHKAAQPYQSGLNDAYLVYEIVVEGGITRLMAVFKDADTEKIGTVRSSRHYYLDYAQENDAVYVHFGWSPQAKKDISSLKINNINGLYDSPFWRDKTLKVATEHTVFTSMEKLNKTIDKKGYRKTSDKETLLNYSVDEIDLSKMEGAIKADDIKIVYSSYQTTSFEYDSINKVYNKISNGKNSIDYLTKEQVTAKNIITYQVRAYNMDDYGRKEIENIGSGEGYFISNGYAVPITWEKTSPSSQTVYKYKNGEEIIVNDGNTYIQIQPTKQKLEIVAK